MGASVAVAVGEAHAGAANASASTTAATAPATPPRLQALPDLRPSHRVVPVLTLRTSAPFGLCRSMPSVYQNQRVCAVGLLRISDACDDHSNSPARTRARPHLPGLSRDFSIGSQELWRRRRARLVLTSALLGTRTGLCPMPDGCQPTGRHVHLRSGQDSTSLGSCAVAREGRSVDLTDVHARCGRHDALMCFGQRK